MSKYVVEISDKNQIRSKILVEFPIIGQDKWTILDDAGWVFEFGVANVIDKTNYKNPGNSGKAVFHKHLNLCNCGKFIWAGVTLWDFQGPEGVNQRGKGVMQNGWSLKSDYGSAAVGPQIIRWEIVKNY
jgi:hypothetical protein